MNLDELVASIPDAEHDNRVRLAQIVDAWKNDGSTVDDLGGRIEKWIGHIWFSSDEAHQQFYKAWSEFKKSGIHGIGGMTMNERLYWFSLIDLWESSDSAAKTTTYAKLKAKV
jgi:hypothetical protein